MSGKRNWGDNITNRMDGKEAPKPFDPVRPVPSKLWKKKYKCKKNKGDHTPVIDHITNKHWWNFKDGWVISSWRWGTTPYYVEWHCTGCGKHMTEYNAPDKKFDKYRHTIYEKEIN